MKIGILGNGRFGSFFFRTLREHGFEVFVCDQGDEGLNKVCQVDILFLCVPISEVISACTKIKDLLPASTIVCDVASVKISPVRAMLSTLRAGQPIIGSHPLFGPDSVAMNGLAGQKVVMGGVRNTNDEFATVRRVFESLELRIIESTVEEHDRAMAHSQALVHFIGRALLPLQLKEQDISTPAYRAILDLIAMVENDTDQLFFDMQRENPFTEDVRSELVDSMIKLNEEI
jgi:prephenate dehydrogenase